MSFAHLRSSSPRRGEPGSSLSPAPAATALPALVALSVPNVHARWRGRGRSPSMLHRPRCKSCPNTPPYQPRAGNTAGGVGSSAIFDCYCASSQYITVAPRLGSRQKPAARCTERQTYSSLLHAPMSSGTRLRGWAIVTAAAARA